MTLLARFLLFNLLPGLAVGLGVWLLVVAATRLLAIRSANLRLGLLAIPLIKSLLLLMGVGLILPWPRTLFLGLHEQALPPQRVIPALLVWAGVAGGVTALLARRARRRLLATARPAPPRLTRMLDALMPGYVEALNETCNNGLRCAPLQPIRPRLLVSNAITAPLALTAGGEPIILFPAGLMAEMDGREMRGVLVHELTHFSLRWPGWCSVALLHKLALVSPVAGLVIASIQREEELVCDEMAVRVTKDAAGYAEMLLKSYRYARARGNPLARTLQMVPGLLGRRPVLRHRIESLLHPAPSPQDAGLQSLYTCLLWFALGALFFAA